MQSITKYHRRIDDNPSHLIALLLQVTHYAEGRCHSKMQSPFPSLNALGPCARMRSAQSGPKPSDTFKFAIYRLQTTHRLAPSLHEKFKSILKCHVVFPCRACAPPKSSPKPSNTFGLRSIACKGLAGLPQSARKVLGHSKMPRSFSSPRMRSARKLAKTFWHFRFAIYCLQRTRRLAASLQAKRF